MNISQIRLSNIKQLQEYLTQEGVLFQADTNKTTLQDLAIAHIKPGAEPVPGEQEDPSAKAAKDAAADEARILEDRRAKEKEEADSMQRSEDEKEKVAMAADEKAAKEEAKAAAEEEEKAAAKEAKDSEQKPGARRDSALQDLLLELSKRGFQNKQELADLLEATQREEKSLKLARKEHDAREEVVLQGEMKLDQRIRDSEEDFKKIHAHRKQCEEMVAKAVALNERTRA